MEKEVLSQRGDVHRQVTDKIIAAIEAGPIQFEMPWHRLGGRIKRPTNPSTGNLYKGVNVLALWADALAKNYSAGYWASYRQWQALGAQVRRGERGSLIVFWKQLDHSPDTAEEPDEKPPRRYLARGYTVFNAAQVEGWLPPELPHQSNVERLERIETIIAKTGARIREGRYDIACYDAALDQIDMPSRQLFKGTATISPTESYYATLFHELTHWTGHRSRLARDMKGRFGDTTYAIEELVAELGAAFLAAELGVSPEPRPDHAAYVADWLRILKKDARAIFVAATKASTAAEFVLSGRSVT